MKSLAIASSFSVVVVAATAIASEETNADAVAGAGRVVIEEAKRAGVARSDASLQLEGRRGKGALVGTETGIDAVVGVVAAVVEVVVFVVAAAPRRKDEACVVAAEVDIG